MSKKAIWDKRISKSNCGMIKGKPRMATIAAFCPALAAIAAKSVKTRLRLIPPKQVMKRNLNGFSNGFPSKRRKSSKLMQLMASINTELKINFDIIKSLDPAMV